MQWSPAEQAHLDGLSHNSLSLAIRIHFSIVKAAQSPESKSSFARLSRCVQVSTTQ